jgi:PIN domain
VPGDGVRLAIFRGPGQMKYSADIAEAWQPLGANVTFVRCAKAGRNAVDMHIAFHLGELVAAQARAEAGRGARFFIVSRDTDFDPLLMHIRSEGFEAARVVSIKAALGGGAAEKAEPRAAKTRSRRGKAAAEAAPAPAEKPAKRAAKKTPAAKKAVAKKAPAAKKVASLIPVPAPQRRPARAPAVNAPAVPDARAKVIESLQRMGEKRPTKRKGLERHIESHLGRNLEPGRLETLMSQLERDGVLVFNDKNHVEYRLPKARK